MSLNEKIEPRQVVVALVLIGMALTRILWPELISKMDIVFLILMGAGLVLLVIPLKSIRMLKAGGLEFSLETPQVQSAVASLGLSRIDDATLRNKLKMHASLLTVVGGSKVLWIDDRPEKIIGERRLLRALGVTVISAISSTQAQEILSVDNDYDLIISDVQRAGESYKLTGGVDIHEGVNFIVWLRTSFSDPFIKEIPVLFYAAYDWPRLVEFTRPARETLPEPKISNSVADFLPKVLLALADSRESMIKTPSEKTATEIRPGTFG